MKAQSGSRGIALLFPEPRQRMEVGGQRHALAALPPGKRPGTHFTGGWVGHRAGLDGCGGRYVTPVNVGMGYHCDEQKSGTPCVAMKVFGVQNSLLLLLARISINTLRPFSSVVQEK